MKQMKKRENPISYQIISFDVTSLFTLDNKMEITLHRIYGRNDIVMQIPKKVMKYLLLMCTKKVHFMCGNRISKQNDGVAVGSSLHPVLSGTFKVELETSIMCNLGYLSLKWKKYIDDTICYVKIGTVNHILNKLSDF